MRWCYQPRGRPELVHCKLLDRQPRSFSLQTSFVFVAQAVDLLQQNKSISVKWLTRDLQKSAMDQWAGPQTGPPTKYYESRESVTMHTRCQTYQSCNMFFKLILNFRLLLHTTQATFSTFCSRWLSTSATNYPRYPQRPLQAIKVEARFMPWCQKLVLDSF